MLTALAHPAPVIGRILPFGPTTVAGSSPTTCPASRRGHERSHCGRKARLDAASVASGPVECDTVMTGVGRLPEPLADDFFRLCHDDRTGGLLLDDEAARVGLASALLGELGWLGRLTIEQGFVIVRHGPAPTDAVAHVVLDDIRGERQPRDVRTWLTFLSIDAYDRVARRLVAANHFIAQERRRMLRRSTCYMPTDANHHALPRARLATGLAQRRVVDLSDVHLAGIADATGLLPIILDWGGQAAHAYYAQLIAQAHPDVQTLVQETRIVIGAKVMGRR
jgi:hypothetical protein